MIEDPAPRYAGDTAVQAPDGTTFLLVLPADTAGVQEVLRLAHETGTPVVPRGAGSGLSGGAAPSTGAIVLGLERLTRIREIDLLDEVAVVEAGVITADLSAALAPHGVFYAPDPASARLSTIGGNIATNAGGLHCAKYGVTRESVLGLEAVLADGTLLRTGHRSIKGVTGLDLTQLLIGSEGTLAVITAATVRIRPLPVARRTVLARFDSAGAAAEGVNAISRSPVRPAATELMDGPTLADIDAHTGSELARGESTILLIELDGYGIDEQLADLAAALTAAGGTVREIDDEAEAEHLWELRRSGRGSGAGGAPPRRGRRGAEVPPRRDVRGAARHRTAPRRGDLRDRPCRRRETSTPPSPSPAPRTTRPASRPPRCWRRPTSWSAPRSHSAAPSAGSTASAPRSAAGSTSSSPPPPATSSTA